MGFSLWVCPTFGVIVQQNRKSPSTILTAHNSTGNRTFRCNMLPGQAAEIARDKVVETSPGMEPNSSALCKRTRILLRTLIQLGKKWLRCKRPWLKSAEKKKVIIIQLDLLRLLRQHALRQCHPLRLLHHRCQVLYEFRLILYPRLNLRIRKVIHEFSLAFDSIHG